MARYPLTHSLGPVTLAIPGPFPWPQVKKLTAATGGFDLNSFPQEASMLVTLSRKIAHV
jgi:hypothetical protein